MGEIYENCRNFLEQNLIPRFSETDIEQLNEATTRFKFIDDVFTKCLDWTLENIKLEESYNGNYTDYILSLFRSGAINNVNDSKLLSCS